MELMKILEWGIYLIVFCLPLYLVRFRIFGIPTTVLEILIYALFIIWLFNKFIRNTRYEIRATKSLFIPIILILVGVSLATIFSSDLRTSAGIWKAWFIDPILFFIVLISVIKEKPAASQGKQAGPSKCEAFVGVLFSLFLSGTVVSIISLIYLVLGKFDPVGRLQAFYTSPNYLAMYLAPALIIGVGFLITRRNLNYESLVILSSSVFILLSIFFTHSYGAWWGIIAAICFGLVFYCFKLKKVKLAILFLCLFILASLFLGHFALNSREASLNARLIIWQKAGGIFKENWIFGIGPGTFQRYFPPYPEWGVPQPHNIFLAFLLQMGIIGFIGFIGLLFWFFKTGFKLLNTHHLSLITILMSVMIYILVHGLVDTTYWKNDLSAVFWLIVGLMMILKKASE